jgi:hypothetical protein
MRQCSSNAIARGCVPNVRSSFRWCSTATHRSSIARSRWCSRQPIPNRHNALVSDLPLPSTRCHRLRYSCRQMACFKHVQLARNYRLCKVVLLERANVVVFHDCCRLIVGFGNFRVGWRDNAFSTSIFRAFSVHNDAFMTHGDCWHDNSCNATVFW